MILKICNFKGIKSEKVCKQVRDQMVWKYSSRRLTDWRLLNKATNNNDVKHVENKVFNEAHNSNDAMRVSINVHLTAVGAQQFSMVTI